MTRAAFIVGCIAKVHQKDLPFEPRSWKEVLKHPYKTEWVQAAKVKWQKLFEKNTFEVVDRSVAKTKPISFIQVFRYKIDEDGYLKSFRSRICIRRDLQPLSDRDTYTATLANKSLRILLTFIIRWDLEIRQFNTINVFPNVKFDEMVYIELLDRFKIQGKIALFFQALYGLR